MRINLTVVVLSVVIFCIGLLTWKYLYVVEPVVEKDVASSPLFPLDEPEAEYYLSAFDEAGYYQLSYYKYGLDKSDASDPKEVFSQLIGSSNVELEPFVGKKVHVSGSVYMGQPLCKRECDKFTRPVLAIDSITFAD